MYILTPLLLTLHSSNWSFWTLLQRRSEKQFKVRPPPSTKPQFVYINRPICPSLYMPHSEEEKNHKKVWWCGIKNTRFFFDDFCHSAFHRIKKNLNNFCCDCWRFCTVQSLNIICRVCWDLKKNILDSSTTCLSWNLKFEIRLWSE